MGLFSGKKKNKGVFLDNDIVSARVIPLGAQIKDLYYKGVFVGQDGISVGRFANRIRYGRLAIGSDVYQLDTNENGHCLHGGSMGFEKLLWEQVPQKGWRQAVFRLLSPDGDMGFPGNLQAEVCYTLDGPSIHVKFRAVSDKDTVINLVNHTYFNLNDEGGAAQHHLQINADSYTKADSDLVPTGEILPVEGTVFDYRQMRSFEPNIDQNFVLRGSGMREAARLMGDLSGIILTVWTDQPGMQVYNTDTHIALEAQHFPDSPNHPDFPSTLLKAGEEYTTETIYSFTEA